MRSNDSLRRLGANFVKMLVLVMCFATVFAIVMTADLSGIGTDSAGNIAEAIDAEWSEGNAVTAPILLGDTDIQKVHESVKALASDGSVTFTYSSDIIDFSRNNVYAFGDATSSLGNWTIDFPATGQDRIYSMKDAGTVSTAYAYLVLNIAIPEIFLNLRDAGYTVGVQMFVDTDTSANGNNTWVYAGCTSAAQNHVWITNCDDAGMYWTVGRDGWQDLYEITVPKDFTDNGESDNQTTEAGWFKVQDSDTTFNLAIAGRGNDCGIWLRRATTISFKVYAPSTGIPPSDGNLPVIDSIVAEKSTLSADVSQYLNPNLPSSLMELIEGNVSYNDDSVAGTIINLDAAIVRANSISHNNTTYSKQLQVVIYDTNSSGEYANPAEEEYYAGIEKVKIGETSLISGEGPFSYGGEENNGYIEVVSDASGSTATVTLYFRDNATDGIAFDIYEYGNETPKTYTIKVDGIKSGYDSGKMGIGNLNSKYVNNDYNEILPQSWYLTETLELSLTPVGASSKNPLILFYDTAYSQTGFDDITSPGALADDQDIKELIPFNSVTGVFELYYDFVKGMDTAVGDEVGKTIDGTTGDVGAGYYRFAFYSMNYAGYINPNPYYIYVKVDPTIPELQTEFSYDADAPVSYGDENKDHQISPYGENGAYVAGDITINATFSSNFSGNVLTFTGVDGVQYYAFITHTVGSGETPTKVEISKIVDKDGRREWGESLTQEHEGASLAVKLDYAVDTNKVTVSFLYSIASGLLELESAYTLGRNTDMTTIKDGGDGGDFVIDEEWAGGKGILCIYIDKIASEIEAIEETAQNSVFENSTGTIPSGGDRVWRNDDWNVELDFTFSDEARALYYRYEYLGDGSSLAERVEHWKGLSLNDSDAVEEAFINASFDGGEYYASLIELAFGENANEFVLDNELLEFGGEKAGYYAIYAIAIDRAGNVGELAIYGVLVDATDYFIGTRLAEGYKDEIGEAYTFNYYIMKDGVLSEFVPSESFKRGDSIYFQPVLSSAVDGCYVPYKIYKATGSGSATESGPLYVHPDGRTDGNFVASGIQTDYQDYASVYEKDPSILQLAVDREKVVALPIAEASDDSGNGQIVYSYRRFVNVAPNATVFSYTGENIIPSLTFSYTDANGTAIEINDSMDKVYEVIYEGEATNVGQYSLTIGPGSGSDYYILMLNEDGTNPKYNFDIGKAVLTVDFSGESVYGDATADNVSDLLDAVWSRIEGTNDGLLGQDKDSKTLGDIISGDFAFKLNGIPATGNIAAGAYAVTLSGEMVADNYLIVLNGLTYTINAKVLDIVADSSVQYGEKPAYYQLTIAKSALTNTAGVAIAADAAAVAEIFGVDASAVSEDGDNWVITVSEEYFVVESVGGLNEFGFLNVGTYDIASVDPDVVADANFKANVADGGKLNVTPRTVTVRPWTEQVFYVDNADLISGVEVRFAVNSTDLAKFGVSGRLFVGDLKSGITYAVKDDVSGLTSTHNFDGIQNVVFALNLLTSQGAEITVDVIISSGTYGTFTITFDESVTFETVFGKFWDSSVLDFDAHNYTVEYSGADIEGVDIESLIIEWSVYVNGYASDAANVLRSRVGSYPISIRTTGFGGEVSIQVSNYKFVFCTAQGDSVSALTVAKRPVTLTAVTLGDVTSKVYGDVEPAWAFNYTFEGLPEGYAAPTVNGLTRANVDGTAAGTRYDDAGTYGIYNRMSVDDPNLQISFADDIDEQIAGLSVTIEKRLIQITSDILSGVNKDEDGSSEVVYASEAERRSAVAIGSQLVNGDDVWAVFSANYVDAGGNKASAPSDELKILFVISGLAGTKATNYTIGDVAIEITLDGPFAIKEVITITINKTDFTVSKQYDGTSAISVGNIQIVATSGVAGRAFSVARGYYGGVDAASYTLSELVLVFDGVDYDSVFDKLTLGPDVTASDADGKLQLTISNISATIVPRLITLRDLILDMELVREYDGTTNVGYTYDFTDSFKGSIAGFVTSDVGLVITATVPDKNVKRQDGAIISQAVTYSAVSCENANYTVTGGDICDADGIYIDGALDFAGTELTINPRTLSLVAEFEEKTYNGDLTTQLAAGSSLAVEGVVDGAIDVSVDGSVSYVYSDADGNQYPYVQVGEDYYIDGTRYYHDVKVAGTLRFTPDATSGFDWNNYTLAVRDISSTGSETAVVSNLVISKGAVMSKKQVNINISLITVDWKYFDGTTNATLDFSETINDVIEADRDTVLNYIDYSASFNVATVNANVVNVSSMGIRDNVDPSDAAIIDSYIISVQKSYSIRDDRAANKIRNAPLGIVFTLPEKLYDSTTFVNEEEVSYSLIGLVAGENEINFDVNAIAAAYNDPNVNHLSDGQIGYVEGYVYGFLTNNSATLNYVAAHVSKDSSIEGLTQYKDGNGNPYTTVGQDGTLYYYYELPTQELWYLNDSELASLKEENAELFAKLNIVSEFNYGSEVMYALEVVGSLTTEEESQLGEFAIMVKTRKANALGKIKPAAIGFSIEIINPADSIWQKTFDDSDGFSDEDGVPLYKPYGSATDEGYDFRVVLTSDGAAVGNIGATLTQDNFAIYFIDANAGSGKTVVFELCGTAASNNNYEIVGGTKCEVPALGTIKKASIDASLNGGDATVKYGTEWNYSVSYKTATNSRTVYIDAEGYAYIATADYADAGFNGTTEGRVTYVTADSGVTFTEGEGTEGVTTYYRLSGKFGQVVPVSDKGSGSAIVRDGKYVGANVGRYSNVIPVGRADNFTITGSDGITVTVDKAQLVVAPTDAAEGEYAYSGTYCGSIPVPALTAQSGLAKWDDFATVVNGLTVGFTLSTATTPTAITNRATPSFDLSEGYYKLFVSGEFSNYTVQLGNGSTEYKLYLALPTLAASTFTVKESLTKVYDAKAVTGADILNGLTASDTATVDWAEGADRTNAGTANFAGITVKRTIGDYWYVAPGANEADEISWTSATEGTYTITQRALTVRATSSLNFTYDGTDHQLDRSKLAATSAGGVGDTSGFIANADIKLLFNGEEVSAMRDAGGYTVSISLSASDARNYAVTNNVGTIVVARAPITVSVDAASKTYDVTDGVSGNEAIHFTVASGAVGGDSLTEDDFTVTYRDSSGSVVSAIPTAGVYNYTITCADPNYTVVGGGTGNISATISGVSYKSGDTTFAQITFSAPVTVDYKLQDTALAEGTPYWSIVEENVRALSDENYDTNGIVRLQLTANGSTVSSLPDGSSVTIRALLPEGVSADDKVFYVNSNGGLTELTDYQIANGYITYTTSYISNLVFVGMPSFVLAWWVYLLIAVLVVLIIAAAILIAVLAKLRRAPDPVEREEEPVEPELVPEPVVAADIAPEAPVIEPVTYDAPAAVSKHGQPPIIGIR